MTVKQMILAAAAVMALGTVPGALPAHAQYGYGGGGYGRDYGGDDYRPRRNERRFEDEDDRPRPRRFGRGGGGSICVTARGNCQYPPAPRNASCSCDIPGFGEKRGAIGGGY